MSRPSHGHRLWTPGHRCGVERSDPRMSPHRSFVHCPQPRPCCMDQELANHCTKVDARMLTEVCAAVAVCLCPEDGVVPDGITNVCHI